MPSEHRLHPLSIGFVLLTQIRRLVVPMLVGGFSASQWNLSWQVIVALILVPVLASSVIRYMTFRYSYGDRELVVRSGLIFRKERHIPYARIQNLDAVQSVLHRLVDVVEVKLQTGAGNEPEAVMNVIPVSAVPELRRRVFEGRRDPGSDLPGTAAQPAPVEGADEGKYAAQPEADPGAEMDGGPEATAAGTEGDGDVLLHLPASELLIYGLIQNRGMIVIAAGLGLAWEVGIMEMLTASFVGDGSWARGFLRELIGSEAGSTIALGGIAIITGAIVVLLLLARLLSMAWAIVRLHDFTISRVGEDLRTRFGLFTRVSATIPLRRIQKLTIHEGPLHQLAGRVAVRVETAGGSTNDNSDQAHRQWLAPVLRKDRLGPFVSDVLPELDFSAVHWEPVATGAFRRVMKETGVGAIVVSTPFFLLGAVWGVIALAFFLSWAALYSRKYVESLGWAVTGNSVLFRSGWLWKRVSVARFAKIQVVTVRQTPFDRRRLMARVRVDTAGAGAGSHAVNIPYLPLLRARELGEILSAQAAQTAFQW